MTEVNRSNYHILFPEIISKIQNATFVSIDTEFTGLSSPNPKYRRSLFDTGSKRYEKLRHGLEGSNYLISQFGLGIFTKSHWDKNEWTLEAYNIYLFPPTLKDWNKNTVFGIQVSSLNFLSQYQFDFNKFLREGAPYLRLDDEAKLRKEFVGREELIQQLLGFTLVLVSIREFKIPIVGHNCLLDFLLIMKQFFGPLPESYNEFKEAIIQIFPMIYDTKHMSHSIEKFLIRSGQAEYCDVKALFDTSLYELYKNLIRIKDILSPEIKVLPGGTLKYLQQLEVPTESQDQSVDAFRHEAGLDACLTGAIFLQLAHISFRSFTMYQDTFTLRPPSATEMFMNVKSLANCITMIRCTIPWTNLTGRDPQSSRPPWITIPIPSSDDNPNEFPSLETLKHLIEVVLPKYGDIETKIDEETDEMLIACGGKNCHERIWEEFRSQGFDVYLTSIPDDNETGDKECFMLHSNWKKNILYSGILILSIVGLYRRFGF